jgi:hypothetical protein
VNWGCFIAAVSLIAYGTATIILANFIELYWFLASKFGKVSSNWGIR